MDNKQKFNKFLESLKGKGQDTLIESVKQGFQACFEMADESELKKAKTIKELTFKTGKVIPVGTPVTYKFFKEGMGVLLDIPSADIVESKLRTQIAMRFLSGFTKEPSIKTMEKWSYDGIAKTVTGHRTDPDGHGPDGSPSWMLVLGLI